MYHTDCLPDCYLLKKQRQSYGMPASIEDNNLQKVRFGSAHEDSSTFLSVYSNPGSAGVTRRMGDGVMQNKVSEGTENDDKISRKGDDVDVLDIKSISSTAEDDSKASPKGWELASGIKKRKQRPLKKDPRAPKRFRSSYIFFSQDRFPEIREELKKNGTQLETVHITKMVSEEWKNLGHREKMRYEEMSALDKERYEVEKKMYSGSWQVPTSQKLTKDVTAPRRPASAFLMFSNPRRAALKKENPDLCNGEISKLLSKMWKEATPAERKPFEEEEIKLRNQYKDDVAIWREKHDARLQKRQDNALRLAERGVSASDVSRENSEGAAGGGRSDCDSPEVVYSGTIPGRGGQAYPFTVDGSLPPRPPPVAFPSAAVLPGHPALGWGGAGRRMGYPAGEEVVFQRIHGTGPRFLIHRPAPSIPSYFTYEESPVFPPSLQEEEAAATPVATGAPPRVYGTTTSARSEDPSMHCAASGLVGMASGLPPPPPGAAEASNRSSGAPIAFVNEHGVPMMLQAVPIPMVMAGSPHFAGPPFPPNSARTRYYTRPPADFVVPAPRRGGAVAGSQRPSTVEAVYPVEVSRNTINDIPSMDAEEGTSTARSTSSHARPTTRTSSFRGRGTTPAGRTPRSKY
eukprot:Nitzschia sp. Nitz4//scaffold57_size113557//110894//113019//NITZ4_004010-RA/size113557-processed-gene-0.23-mRNA-1//1//CDS//3329554903//1302//frame0